MHVQKQTEIRGHRRAGALLAGCGLAFGLAGSAAAQPVRDVDLQPDDRRSSLVQRGPVLPAPRGDEGSGVAGRSAMFPLEFRTIDGLTNNPAQPTWGATGIELKRLAAADYADGIGAPSGGDRPSARAISNAVNADTGVVINARGASAFLWQWGQFLDHDIDETPVASGEAFDIAVPAGDPWFDPMNTGAVTISLDRSAGSTASGERQQLNNITAFIDASNVYGSEHALADWLRTNDGTGMLKTSAGDLLPYNTDGFPNAPTGNDPSLFLGGDIRANEQVGLTAMHTLFVREHNFWAEVISFTDPGLTGDEIYERARAMVAAEMQAITYNEFLPLLLGPDAMPPYQGWQDAVDPSITNEFATAAYRVGHTMLNSTLLRTSADGSEAPEGHLPLLGGFFNPSEIEDHGIDTLLRGFAAQPAFRIDTEIVDDVRNFLFGPPGAGGFDLASLNIQRGRDHGLPSYNDVRVAVGLAPIADFDGMFATAETRQRLASVYDSIDDVDPWVGMLAERHRPGALVGETMFRVLRDQFQRLRDGDRFWYQSYLPADMAEMIDQQTLSVIIRRNTSVGAELQDRAFVWEPACLPDTNEDGALTPADFNGWIRAFNDRGFRGDQNRDGMWTPADFNAWVLNYTAGC